MAQLAEAAIEATDKRDFTLGLNLTLKRFTDIALSGAALLFLSPFLLMVAILIRLESRGPALFVQERWGRDMIKIRVYKFRSMFTDKCDASGVAQTVPGDSRVTAVGRIIRRTNIDELPQLFNVLKGDLSLVGPRCHPVGMRAADMLYEELVPEYHRRHLMRPGITGLAQANGYRGPTVATGPSIRRIEYDLEYIASFNIFLDAKILLQTVTRELFGGTGS